MPALPLQRCRSCTSNYENVRREWRSPRAIVALWVRRFVSSNDDGGSPDVVVVVAQASQDSFFAVPVASESSPSSSSRVARVANP